MQPEDIAEATATLFREHHGRLVALLAARTRDIAAAQDAVAEALRKACDHWPCQGLPANPAAWLLTAARNHLRDELRHGRVHDAFAVDYLALHEEAQDHDALAPRKALHHVDERLGLLFACAHPAIDPAVLGASDAAGCAGRQRGKNGGGLPSKTRHAGAKADSCQGEDPGRTYPL